TLIPGDGIGQETAAAVKTIFRAANVPIEWEQLDVTGHTQEGDILFKQSIESIRRNKVALKDLDIYASLVLIKNIKGYPTRHNNVDFAIIRENTEGEYAGLEHQVAKDYEASGIKFDDMIVDNCSMQLVSKPQQFDVMVMPNLYGNIVSNVGAALVGGPGIIPGANIGREYALFEPGCRHVGRDIQGNNTANPTALILSGVMMLHHLGLGDSANRIHNAVKQTIKRGAAKTPDMGGTSSTTNFTLSVISNL
ncbi:13732_t:CDS:2, partial [Racocetra fulgida]